MITASLFGHGRRSSASKETASTLELIGNTPIVRVNNMDTGPCELYLKLENQNPGGSIKDRIALRMIEAAEKSGQLKAGGTLVDATAGNTGLALALVALQKGYKLSLVVFDKVSQEKIFHLKSMGAQITTTRSDVTHDHPDYYHNKAKSLAASIPGAFYVNQFENPINPEAHEQSTAPEMWEQMDHKIDAVVCGVGTGGTLTGLGRFFKKVSPSTRMILADPKGSILAPYINTGIMPEAGTWLVEGIGEDYIPLNCDLSFVSEAYTITDEDSILTARELLLKEGILCGSSSGTLIAGALRYCRAQTKRQRVITFVCDSGNKYLSKIFNPYWLHDNGIVDTAETGDLRDLIARPYVQGKVVSVSAGDSLNTVYARMKNYDVSQVPVMQDGKVIGLVSEAQLLLAVLGNPKGFTIHAGAVMDKSPPTIKVSRAMTDLLPLFESNHAACVLDDEQQFLGLVTPIDFLNYLRKRAGKA